MPVIAELDDIEAEDRLILDRAIKRRAELETRPYEFDPTADEWKFETYTPENLDLKIDEGRSAFSQYAESTDLTLGVRSKGDKIWHSKIDEIYLIVDNLQ